MKPHHLFRRAILGWENWRSRRALRRKYPELSEWDRRERECRKLHRRGSAAVSTQRQKFITQSLARELGREWHPHG